jgi:FixJ family two-component response regulator
MTTPSPVIHVVDDDRSFRTAIARLLEASGYRVALYESGDQLLQGPPSIDPGCILLDMRMSGLNGLELQERLARLDSILPIVFLTAHGDIPTSVQAIRGGAEDFLTKPVTKATLLQAIEHALARYAQRRERHDLIGSLRARVSALTPRESAVFALVVRGKLNKQIAHDLRTSERTVKAHRQSIMKKLNVRSVAEAVSIAAKLGMLSAPVDGADAKMPDGHPPAEGVDSTKGQ